MLTRVGSQVKGIKLVSVQVSVEIIVQESRKFCIPPASSPWPCADHPLLGSPQLLTLAHRPILFGGCLGSVWYSEVFRGFPPHSRGSGQETSLEKMDLSSSLCTGASSTSLLSGIRHIG